MAKWPSHIARLCTRSWEVVSGLLWPEVCCVCGASLVDGERSICLDCLAAMPTINNQAGGYNPMLDKLISPGLRLEHAAAWFYYHSHSPYASIVYDLKYHHLPRVGRDAGWIFARRLLAETDFFTGVDLLLPVGISRRKRAHRGYNQTEWIARGLSEATGIAVGDNVKARHHESQTRKSAATRRSNVKGVYTIDRPHELAGKHVVVVDDVCTTGSTLLSVLTAIHDVSPSTRLSALTLGCTSN